MISFILYADINKYLSVISVVENYNKSLKFVGLGGRVRRLSKMPLWTTVIANGATQTEGGRKRW